MPTYPTPTKSHLIGRVHVLLSMGEQRRSPTATNPMSVPLLLEIAERSILADDLRLQCRSASADLSDAYKSWKVDNRVDRIEPETPEWAAMMAATTAQYQSLQTAQNNERKAKRRLHTSIARFRRSAASSAD